MSIDIFNTHVLSKQLENLTRREEVMASEALRKSHAELVESLRMAHHKAWQLGLTDCDIEVQRWQQALSEAEKLNEVK